MGIPLDIFSLHHFQRVDANCQHYLLLKVEQPSFNNADAGDYAHAVNIADEKRRVLIDTYQSKTLTNTCAGLHALNLVGELQSQPAGDELLDEHGGFYVDLWIAETRFGYPWIVMGTANDEKEFWSKVEQDEALSGLVPKMPAKKQRVYFITEKGNAKGNRS